MTAKTAPGWTHKHPWMVCLPGKGSRARGTLKKVSSCILEAEEDCRTRQGRRGRAGLLVFVQLIDRLQAKIHLHVLWCGQTMNLFKISPLIQLHSSV